jgi:lysophospholipase L1-like esterase
MEIKIFDNRTMIIKKKLLFTAFCMLALPLMAQHNVPKPLADVNNVVDLTLDSLNKAQTARIPAGSSRNGKNPVLFLVGNSTMRNGTLGNGNNGQWGWGFFAHTFFDESKITVENQALGGTSSRTFYNKLWPDVRKALKPGDWVIISIGHNDNGPYDSGRARASIPGVGHDSLNVTIKETGVKETVYTYGEYMRRFIHDCRAVGAHPILMSLTPRDAYDEKTGKIVRKIHTQWLMQVAAEEGVPFIDLNEISGEKLDSYSKWKEKYFFYQDHIHGSRFGAMMNARSAAEGIAMSDNPALKPLQNMMLTVELPSYKVQREKGKPVVWFTGDSTVKNTDKDKNGMWGLGSQAYTVFDKNKITCYNAAQAGRSTRTYLNEGRWDKVYNALQPGDYVFIQFGHNDIGGINTDKERGVIPGASDTCHVYKSAKDGTYELVYSFGWYLKKFIDDVREKGATPILVSLTPRNEWSNGKIERRNDTYGKWYRDVVSQTGVEFVDLHNIMADYLDKKCGCKAKADKYYNHDHTHSSLLGAKTNAHNIAIGLKAIHSKLASYLK